MRFLMNTQTLIKILAMYGISSFVRKFSKCQSMNITLGRSHMPLNICPTNPVNSVNFLRTDDLSMWHISTVWLAFYRIQGEVVCIIEK